MEKQIQWFPGHMAKAYRIIRDYSRCVDCVIEVLDSRCPKSTINKQIKEYIGDLPLLLVCNKSDLCDLNKTKEIVKEIDAPLIIVNSLTGKDTISLITKAIEEILKNKIESMRKRGMHPYPIKAMVVGCPNTGKSTLLNAIAKRNALETKNTPGVTKNVQFLRANDHLLLLDNPGTLFPKFESEEQGLYLASIGSIKDDILPLERVCEFLLNKISLSYPTLIEERYKIKYEGSQFFEELGKKRGFFIKGGEVDKLKVYQLILKEFRMGIIGKITLE